MGTSDATLWPSSVLTLAHLTLTDRARRLRDSDGGLHVQALVEVHQQLLFVAEAPGWLGRTDRVAVAGHPSRPLVPQCWPATWACSGAGEPTMILAAASSRRAAGSFAAVQGASG